MTTQETLSSAHHPHCLAVSGIMFHGVKCRGQLEDPDRGLLHVFLHCIVVLWVNTSIAVKYQAWWGSGMHSCIITCLRDTHVAFSRSTLYTFWGLSFSMKNLSSPRKINIYLTCHNINKVIIFETGTRKCLAFKKIKIIKCFKSNRSVFSALIICSVTWKILQLEGVVQLHQNVGQTEAIIVYKDTTV